MATASYAELRAQGREIYQALAVSRQRAEDLRVLRTQQSRMRSASFEVERRIFREHLEAVRRMTK